MHLAVFDLDGTLTRTTGVDDQCFIRAMGEVLGLSGFCTDWAQYPHATDQGLAIDICRLEKARGGLGRPPTSDELARVRSRFIELLEQTAAAEPHRFEPVPGVDRFLQALGAGPRSHAGPNGWTVAIATGAWRESALIKLRCADLAWLVGESGVAAAFAGNEGEGAAAAREEIVGLAIRRAAQHAGVPRFDRVVCLGDGVWDLRTARRLGHGFVGIADGPGRDRLLREGAPAVIPDFSDTQHVLHLLRQAATHGKGGA